MPHSFIFFWIVSSFFGFTASAMPDFCEQMGLSKFRAEIRHFPSDDKSKSPKIFVTFRSPKSDPESCNLPSLNKDGNWIIDETLGEEAFPDPSQKKNKAFAKFYKKYCHIGSVSKREDINRDGMTDFIVTSWDRNGAYGGPTEYSVFSSRTSGWYCNGWEIGYLMYQHETKRELVKGFSLPHYRQISHHLHPECLNVRIPKFDKELKLDLEPLVLYGLRTKDPHYVDPEGRIRFENFEDCEIESWINENKDQVEKLCEEKILKQFAGKRFPLEFLENQKCIKEITSIPELEGQVLETHLINLDKEKYPFLKKPESFGRFYHRANFRDRPTPEHFALLDPEDKADLEFLKNSFQRHYIGSFVSENPTLQVLYLLPESILRDDPFVKKVVQSGRGCLYSVDYLPKTANDVAIPNELQKILGHILTVRGLPSTYEQMVKLIEDLQLTVSENYACLQKGTDSKDELRLKAFKTKKGLLDLLISEEREDVIIRFLKPVRELSSYDRENRISGLEFLEGSKSKELKKELVRQYIPLIKDCALCFLEKRSPGDPWGSRWEKISSGLEAKYFPELSQFPNEYSLCGSSKKGSTRIPISSWEDQDDFIESLVHRGWNEIEKSQVSVSSNLITEMCLSRFQKSCEKSPRSLACTRSRPLFQRM